MMEHSYGLGHRISNEPVRGYSLYFFNALCCSVVDYMQFNVAKLLSSDKIFHELFQEHKLFMGSSPGPQ